MAIGPNAERLSTLYREYMERVARGERIAPDVFCAQYPDESPWLRPMLEPTRSMAAPPPASTASDLFDGRYRVVKELGRGGFGRVLLMADTEHQDRLVALKLLDPGFSDRHVIDYFRREIEVLRDLGHPDIPKILNDRRTPAGEFYFTMEFADGRSLEDIVSTEAPLRIDRVLRLLQQILDVLAHTHNRGVIHRDLKPSNIIVTNPGTEREHVKVLDFGVAKVLDDAPVAPGSRLTIVGTRDYMAPEQVLGDPVDERTDLFAIGVIAYRMLTGAFPYAGADASIRRDRRLNAEAQPLDTAIPYEMRQFIARLMSREREKRPATEETRRIVAALAGGEPAPKIRPNPSGGSKRRVRIGGAIAAAIVVASIAVVAVQSRKGAVKLPATNSEVGTPVQLQPMQVTVRDQNTAAVANVLVIAGRDTVATGADGTARLRVSRATGSLQLIATDRDCYRTADSYPLAAVDVQRGECELRITRTCGSPDAQSTPAGARATGDARVTTQRTGDDPGQKPRSVNPVTRPAFRKTYTIQTSPSPAAVFLDGEPTSCTDDFGRGKRELKAGSHRFVVRANGRDIPLEYVVPDGDVNSKLVLDFQTPKVIQRP